jgi:hypothetical protein
MCISEPTLCLARSRMSKTYDHSGVNYVQGYHIGLPRPIAEVLPAL